MKNQPLFSIILVAAITAIIVVVVLKLMDQSNPVVTAGGVSGGVTGALISVFSRKNK